EGAQPGHDLGVLGGHVLLLTGVGGEVVQFDRAGPPVRRLRAGVQVLAQRLPVAHADALLSPVARRLAVEERARRLLLAPEGRGEADAVEVARRLVPGAAEFEQRGQPVLEPGDAVTRGARGDPPLPADQTRLPKPA